jgi:hypothetical protein
MAAIGLIMLPVPAVVGLTAFVGLMAGWDFGKLLYKLDKSGYDASQWCAGLAVSVIAAYFGHRNFGWLGLSGLLAIYPGYLLSMYCRTLVEPMPPPEIPHFRDLQFEKATQVSLAGLGCLTGVVVALVGTWTYPYWATTQGIALPLVGTIFLIPVAVGAMQALFDSMMCVGFAIRWWFITRLGG